MRTKGPNQIPYEYNHDDGVITNFKIRQGICKFGDEVFRKQAINIGFFNSELQFVEHANIVIED